MEKRTPREQLLERRVGELLAAADVRDRRMSFLAHDVRGALNGVLLMLEVLGQQLSDRPESSQPAEDLEIARRSVMGVVNLLERHLYVDRLSQGRVAANVGVVELGEVVCGVVAGLAAAAQAKGSEVVVSVAPEALVRADASLLTAAVRELLDNAIKHGARGTVQITAEKVCGEEGARWVMAIRDGGPGIAPERLAKLLNPALRGDLEERGLGLILAGDAVGLFGARLEAESRVGGGTTLRIVLQAAG